MKRFLVVLTILALAAGFAFAAISGSVTASYTFEFAKAGDDGFNADAFTAGYTTPGTGRIDASFNLDSQSAGFTGENAPYVVLEVKASIDGYYNYDSKHAVSVNVQNLTRVSWTFKIATFKIVGEDWELNLMNAEGGRTNLATSAIDYYTFCRNKIEQKDVYYNYSNNVDQTSGVSLTYKGYAVGMGFNSDGIDKYPANITLEAKTPEYTFGDVKVQAGAGFSQKFVVGNDNAEVRKYGLSAKVAYDADVKASVAIDAGIVGEDGIAFDLAANLQVAPVTADLYFANKTTSASYKTGNTTWYAPVLNELLSARVEIALGDVIEEVPVTLTFTGKDLLKKNSWYTDWSVAANTTAIENFDITLTAGGLNEKEEFYLEGEVAYTGIENLEIDADVSYEFAAKVMTLAFDATYEVEKYTAEGGITIATDFEDTFFAFNASVKSDKLVEGATLKAAFDGFDFGSNVGDFELAATALTLSCTVKF